MNTYQSMCEFRSCKQSAFDEACCAFAQNENMTAIANECGITPTMLRNKLNPEQPHKLTPVELVAITKASSNYTLLNTLLLGLGVVTAKIPQNQHKANLVMHALEHASNAGDLSKMALDMGGQTRLPRTAKHDLIAKAQAGISNLVLMINELENKTQGVSPFLSMSLDFVANGGSIPGLV